MARRRNLKSITTPIILGAVSVPLSVALLVGWTLLVAQNLVESSEITLDVWLLVLGAISFAVIVTVLVLFSVYLVREILEVRRQDSFIDSVTHELKSPLASIKLCLETKARHDLPGEKRAQLQTMMLEDVDRLSSFIDDVLQASRLANEENVGLTLVEVPVLEVAEQVGAKVTKRRKLDPAAIRYAISEDMRVSTDEAALRVVLRNLVDNAVKYSRGGEVEVEVAAFHDEKGRPTIEVRDRGIGIESQHLKSVFQRFYRVQSEDVRGRKGTGLGLFVVSALVRNLGGRIEARSEGLGKGTTMRVTLPANGHPAARGEKTDDAGAEEVAVA